MLSHVRLFETPQTVAHQSPSVHGISQARILECLASSFSRGSSPPKDRTCVSCGGRQILYHYATWEAWERKGRRLG